MQDYIQCIQNWWLEAMDNFYLSALLSTITTFFLQYTGSSAEAVVIWITFATIDCLLGITIGIIKKQFSVRKLYQFVWKLFVQLSIIMLFAAMLRMVAITTHIELVLTNWIILLFAFFDFTTVIDKLIYLKAPVPKFVATILQILRKRMSRTVATAIGVEEDARLLERALRPDRPDQGSAPRSADHGSARGHGHGHSSSASSSSKGQTDE